MIQSDQRTDYYEMPNLWGRTELTLSQNHVISILGNSIKSNETGKPLKILDAGCGDGIVSHAIKSLYPDVDIYGIDISKEALRHLRDREVNGICSNLELLPFQSQTFDIVFSMDVFEHLPPKTFKLALEELIRVTKQKLFIITPCAETDAIAVQCPHCSTIFNPYHHVNCITTKFWLDRLPAHALTFHPIGNLKSNLPEKGLRGIFAAENFFSYAEKTLCPLCATEFSSKPNVEFNLAGTFAKFAPAFDKYFGVLHEEIGVEINMDPDAKRAIPSDTDESVTLHHDHTLSSEISFSPSNFIDFTSADSQITQMDFFGTCGKFLLDKTQNSCIAFLYPNVLGHVAKLKLKPYVNRTGRLSIYCFDMAKQGYVQINQTCFNKIYSPEEIHLNIPDDRNLITPYGVMIKITVFATRADSINLLSIIEDQKEFNQIKNSNCNSEIPYDYFRDHEVSIKLDSSESKILNISSNGIKYSLLHLLDKKSNSVYIPKGIVNDLMETK